MSSQITLTENKDKLTIFLVGELDHHTSQIMREKIDAYLSNKEYRGVVFDMSGISFMDSSGIGLLLGRYKMLAKKGIKMEIQGAKDGIDRILRMAGLYQITKKR